MTAQDFGPVGDATVVPDGDAWTLIFVRDLKHPPAVVWQALTDPAEIDQWAPFAADRDLGATGPARLTMIDRETRLELPATVSEAVRRLVSAGLLDAVWKLALGLPGGFTIAAMCPLVESTNFDSPPSSWVVW